MLYTIGNTIAEGAYAIVQECTDYFQQPFVVKIQKPQREKKLVEGDWKRERDIISSLNHPNIIRLYDAFIFNNLYYFVLEQAQGSLRQIILHPERANIVPIKTEFSDNGFPSSIVLQIFSQLLSAVCHIHKKKIIHRDLQVFPTQSI